MAIAEITHQQASTLFNFCQAHKLEKFSFSNDHGAYFCAMTGKHEDNTFQNCVEYLEGMDPRLDGESGLDAHENAGYAFGHDDFGIDLPVSWLSQFLETKHAPALFRIRINPNDVLLEI